MKIELVSYQHDLSDKLRLSTTQEIINKSSSDLLLFSGHTIGSVSNIGTLRSLITNNRTEVLLELQSINSEKIGNCLYHITGGKLISLNTNQLFTQSSEIEGNYELASRLLYEFENNRRIKIQEKNILIIQCGEINILKNAQSENNKVEFRFADDKPLRERFKQLINSTSIILNPIHTPMGNQGKMKKRREYLSKNKHYYFSVSNTKQDSKDLDMKSLQYAFYNGVSISEIEKEKNEYSIRRIYEIE